MNNIDPNWFFSATAQSFAAIVAIIGGFILTKLISLSLNKRNYGLQIEDLEKKLNNKIQNYKPSIIEWKNLKWISFLRRYLSNLNEINNSFRNELEEEFKRDNILPYQEFEEKLKEFINNIFKIFKVSIKITQNREFPVKYKGTNNPIYGKFSIKDKEINEEMNKEYSIKICQKYKLADKLKCKVSAYIYNQIKNGNHFFSRENQLKEFDEILNSIENEYKKLKKSEDIEIVSLNESNLRNLWEGIENIKDGISQYIIEIKSIDSEKNESLAKIKKPIILLFGFGVIYPLILLIVVSVFRNYLCNIYYWIFYLFTILGIYFALSVTYRYFKNI